MKYFTYITLKNSIDFSHMINNGNRIEWSPIRSVISQNRTTAMRESDLSITSMILGVKKLTVCDRTWWERDRAGWPVVLIALVNVETSQYFSKTKRSKIKQNKANKQKCNAFPWKRSLDRGSNFYVAKFAIYCNCDSIIDSHGTKKLHLYCTCHLHVRLHMLRYQRHDNRIYKHYGNTFRNCFYLRTFLRLNSTLNKEKYFL